LDSRRLMELEQIALDRFARHLPPIDSFACPDRGSHIFRGKQFHTDFEGAMKRIPFREL
jgi:hypothetical protein